jgi:hypothetical protein
MSDLSKKMIGTYVADTPLPKSPLKAWLQTECRQGKLRPLVDTFVAAQSEILDGGLVAVEKIDENTLLCRIPCRLFDHESPGTFASEVNFSINPMSGETTRVL